MKFDFSVTPYNIEAIPDGDSVVAHFSDLQLLAHVFAREDDLPEGVDPDKVMRYLIYMFSPNTPLRAYFPDINNRKRYVLQRLNISADEGVETDGYGQMCLMNKPWIIERFIAFTRLHCSEDYAIMATAELRIHALMKKLMEAEIDKSNDDTNYQKGLESWRATINECRKRIMHDESSLALQRSITFSVKAESLDLKPEEYSRIWREKKDIFEGIIP